MGLGPASNVANYLQRTSREIHTRVSYDGFQYSPLPGPNHIRLLTIHPGKPGEELSCSMRAVSLDEKPRYTALSYTWRRQFSILQMGSTLAMEGMKASYRDKEFSMHFPEAEPDARATKIVVCNGKKIGIHANLYEALLSFRKTRPGQGEYWIDAMCMNQKNTKEKTSQVRMMDRIYSCADLVLVWLGDCSSALSQGIQGLEALARLDPNELPPYHYEDNSPEAGHTRASAASSLGFSEGKGTIPFQRACSTTFDLTNRQWFKRIWVLQEFFLAKQVVFLYGDNQISLDAIKTAFLWAYQNPGASIGPGTKPTAALKAIFMPLWLSHIKDIPSTLSSREAITQGRKLSLREWLSTCEGRQATDGRDFVFGGLSLIHPESLQIDRQRLQLETSDEPSNPPPPLPARPGGVSDGDNSQLSPPLSTAPIAPSPLSNGLWDAVQVDYGAEAAEVLVNLAACLLSQKESHSLDLLSIAARPKEMSELDTSIKPSGNDPTKGLPSWAPDLGSWAVCKHLHLHNSLSFFSYSRWVDSNETLTLASQSRLNSKIASAPAEAGGGGKAFAAGTLGQSQDAWASPKISQDGTTLFLDAAAVDTVEEVILNMEFASEEEPLLKFFENLAKLPYTYLERDETSFDAVANCLASTLTTSDDTGKSSDISDKESDDLSISLPAESRPRIWLCEFIDREVRHWITRLRREFENAPNGEDAQTVAAAEKQQKKKEKKKQQLRCLASTYRQLVQKFDSLPWSGTADQGLGEESTAVGKKPLHNSARDQQIQDMRDKSTFGGRFRAKFITKMDQRWNPGSSAFDNDDRDTWVRKQPISTGAQRYANAIHSALAWRSVFRTKDGLIGMGPRWLKPGDRVMLVGGAIVPYLFRHVNEDLKTQVEDLKKKVEKKEKKLHKARQSTDKKQQRLVISHEQSLEESTREVEEVQARIGKRDAWTLVGEAYVEGVMRGEIMETGGVYLFERIAIV